MNLLSKLRGRAARNGLYSVAEYISPPLAMLCATPYLLRHLGVEPYALWVLATAAVSGGSLLWAGFGDAAVKYISGYHGRGDKAGVERMLRTLLTLHTLLGVAVAGALWALTPMLVAHLPTSSGSLRQSYYQALHVGSLLLMAKAIEIVFISTQRAHERYGVAGQISIGVRVAAILAAVLIAADGGSVVAIMWATLAVTASGLLAQALAVWRDIRPESMLPQWDGTAVKELFSFGCFSWIQGATGLLAGQADRLIVAYTLGVRAVAYYSICVQIAQPIHGIVSAGLHVMFPHLGARLSTASTVAIRRKMTAAFLANVVLVAALCVPLMVGGRFLLCHWMGADFAAHTGISLMLVTISFALMGLNVTGHYALMAFGQIRLLALLNLTAAIAMLLAMLLLGRHWGIAGVAAARLVYGPITWLSYRTLLRMLHARGEVGDGPALWRALEHG